MLSWALEVKKFAHFAPNSNLKLDLLSVLYRKLPALYVCKVASSSSSLSNWTSFSFSFTMGYSSSLFSLTYRCSPFLNKSSSCGMTIPASSAGIGSRFVFVKIHPNRGVLCNKVDPTQLQHVISQLSRF